MNTEIPVSGPTHTAGATKKNGKRKTTVFKRRESHAGNTRFQNQSVRAVCTCPPRHRVFQKGLPRQRFVFVRAQQDHKKSDKTARRPTPHNNNYAIRSSARVVHHKTNSVPRDRYENTFSSRLLRFRKPGEVCRRFREKDTPSPSVIFANQLITTYDRRTNGGSY